MKRALLLLCWVSLTPLFGQIQLSPEAEIRIVTVGPYQGELYSAFGHSGIQVYDLKNGLNDFYNYGIFDFDQPNFYLNFARGYLNYRLAVMPYDRVANYYAYQDRYIHEQVLNLDSAQRQKLFDFLTWNAQPENMFYYYDYFYDNCASRIRDAVEQTFEGQVEFDGSYVTTDHTIRDLTDLYLQQQPWGDLGIDLCLGLPMDKRATPYMYMFLPDYIESAFDHATIVQDGEKVPLVKETIVLYTPKGDSEPLNTLLSPMVVFIVILLIGCIITYIGYSKGKSHFWFDAIMFSILGLIGWLLFLLWIATDHNAAAQNMNLLWAIPFHFPMGILLLKRSGHEFIKNYFTAIAFLTIGLLASWAFLPQNLHEALIPLATLVLIRCAYIRYYLNTTK